MWNKRNVIRAATAIIVTLAGWLFVRFLFPSLDYFPPEKLIHNLERSWFINSGMRKLTAVVYLTVALILMAVFFNSVQKHWPGRGSMKGLAFGASIGIVWSFGFLTGWAFLGTTLRAELLNIVVDLISLSVAGWLIGLAVGRDVPSPKQGMLKPWLAILLVAFGFVLVHTLGAMLLADNVPSTIDLLLVPATPTQIIVLSGLGLWVGVMYMVLREGLPFKNIYAQTAFFAFGVFGHSWIWFHLFFVIEFANILHTVLLVGLIGAIGVFAGALIYERIAGWK